MGNYKLTAAAEYIAEALDRLTTLTVTLDQSGTEPVINVGVVAATTNIGAQVGIYDQRGGTDAGWDALPGFGTVTQPVYTGTVVKIAYELAGAPKTYYMAMEEIFKITAVMVNRGARVELWQIANGNAPQLAQIAANGTLVAAFEPNPYNPLQGRV